MNDIITTPNIKDEIRTKRPRLHKVILVNDDYTPREFVVMVLKAEFRTDGRCLCGAVRFVATGEPIGVAWCHCQSCRKHSGAPVSVFVAFTHDAYTVTEGEITKFNSSPGRWRGFCARCGSTLTCEGERSTEMHFHVGAFDNAAGFDPTQHIFPEERLPWLHLGEA